jgi:DNA helicase-2/ATP-dependent DNA helicase PcrA
VGIWVKEYVLAKRKSTTRKRKANRLPRVVREEERLLVKVRKTLSATASAAATLDYDEALVRLRDDMAEARLPEDQAALLEQMDRLAALAETRASYLPGKLDADNPYFAHLGFTTDEGEHRDILLGKKSFLREGVRIVDWRNAPISKVFYRYAEGDYFAEEIAGKELRGEVEARRTVTILGGKLVRVSSAQRIYLHTPAGWQDVSGDETSLKGGAGTASRPDTTVPLLGSPEGGRAHRKDKHLPEIAALLDREQFDLLTREGESLLVVAGGAGSGKTTVALHRLAYLAFHQPKRFRSKRMQVLVFGPALARYISKVLPALGVEGVPVTTLGDWAMAQQQKHFPGLPKRLCPFTPTSVVRFKTHRILIPMVEEAACTAPNKDPVALFDELFTDRGWIRGGVEKHAPGAFTDSEIEEIHRWCTRQQFQRFDGSVPDDDDQPCFDEEDGMILLRLHQLLRGRLMYAKKRKLSYDHLMVDEAQDFSPLELLVLLQVVPGGSVTLAGDATQKITDNDFSSWSEVLEAIGQEHFEVSPLKVSYRSTREIMEVARTVLGPLAPDEPLETVRSGAPVELLRFPGRGEAMTFLGDALADLVRREPTASVVVLTRTSDQADEAYQALHRTDLSGLSRVDQQNFSFGPGIEVTDVASTKGLEFDYVVLLGLDQKNYPDTPNARHLLYVGSTRAIHQLWLMTWSRPSRLLPDWLKVQASG